MLLSLLYVLISGIALPVGGIQMQYLWRNQLGDVYSLGLGSAACLGAAAATMSGWCSLTVGSFVCTLICTIICFFVTLKVNTQQLITFGILFGTFIGSLGTIVVTNAPTGDLLKQYYLWGAANFRLEGVTTWDIIFSLVLFAVGLSAALTQAGLLTRHFKEETEISAWGKALLLLELKTGRTHQIRVHLSAIGCPVRGDFLYGEEQPEEFPGRFALYSAMLETEHPVSGEKILLTALPAWAEQVPDSVLLMDFD